jgi:hypothetical protein
MSGNSHIDVLLVSLAFLQFLCSILCSWGKLTFALASDDIFGRFSFEKSTMFREDICFDEAVSITGI